MKSKYVLTLFLIGILPVLAVLGVAGYLLLGQAPSTASAPVSGAALQATASALQTQNQSIASALKAAIQGTYQDVAKLVANHSDADLSTFVASHPGVSGVAVFSADGKLLKTVPATAQLADPSYGSSDEFKNMMSKFKDNGGQTYLFYTRHLSFPAFVFSVPLDSTTVAQAVLNLSTFFGSADPRGGEISLMDADSGQFFYNSNPAKMQAVFNPGQDPWLAKIQQALAAKQSGWDSNPPNEVAVYTSIGLKSFGIVRLVPLAALQPSKATAQPKSPLDALPEMIGSPTGMTLLITAAACLGWIFVMGSMAFGMILTPLRKASALVLNAAKGISTLTPETAKKYGSDEVGQMVQASALMLQKLQEDKQHAAQEIEETLKKGRAELDAKNREAANQVSSAQQQAQSAKSELNGLNQQLNDKLKELDAMKAMSEGLRNQAEQAKAEIGKLKSQVATAEDAKASAQKQITQAQAQLEDQLKEMEAKLLSTVAASSAIQVSSVRAAAIRTMAEELKTTLGIIKGYVSSALGTTQGGISEKQQEFLGMVINRSARLEKFINDLLDIYQVEIEQEKAPHEEINLASEIEGLAFNFQAQAEVKNIKTKVEAKGTVPKVPIVRRRFNQLWNILYLQVIKDAPRGSSIPITVEPIGDNVKVTVQDPGLTVVAEALPKLFDEFYDPKHTASPQLAGTGLKFALIKTILAAHGGGAVAEKADPGTRLILTFPTKIKKPGEVPAPSPRPSPSVAASPALGLKPTVAPAAGIGMPKPPTPVATPGMAPPSLGKPSLAPPSTPGAPSGMPKPPGGTPGLLDSLISKVPSVTAPGIKPPVASGAGGPMAPTATPGMPKPPAPSLNPPGAPTPLPMGTAPKPPAVSGLSPATPSAPNPGTVAGYLDSLIEKRPPVPPTPQAAPGIPTGAPVPRPVAPGAPAVPGALKPPAPAVPGGMPGMSAVPNPPVGLGAKPPVPGVPPAPTMAPKPFAPPVPGAPAAPNPSTSSGPRPPMPGMSAPAVPKPPMPGMPISGIPAAPKVVPTNIKPTTPPPGVLDLDSMMDGVKTDAGTPKPSAPAVLRPPMPGTPPMGVPGAPKPPAPGVPPGGLDASKAQQKPKDGEGELIE